MYQQIIIAGYLGSDPEMRFTPSGQQVTNFSIATSRKYTGSDGQQVDETTWFRVSVWGNQAESCSQWLKKGDPAMVVGRLIPDQRTGSPRLFQRRDGTAGASFEINAFNVKFLPNGNNGNNGNVEAHDAAGNSAAQPESQAQAEVTNNIDQVIPF